MNRIFIIAILASIVTGCLDNPRDNPFDHWTVEGGSPGDNVPPVPGNSGTIALTVVNPTSVSLAWTKSNDAVTLQEDLEYKVVYSGSDDITTPDDIDDHGTIIQDWTKDLEDKPVSSLTKGNTYYFNVAVRDAKGNRAAYQRAKVDPLGVVYLFSTGTLYNGNLGGRSGADAKCKSRHDASYSHLGCENVRAFISVSGGDSISGMPGNHLVPDNMVIYGPTGKRIGMNWADLLDGNIERTMADADVESSWNYWTGASSNGGATSVNCSSWTNQDGFLNFGQGGDQTQTRSTWLENAFMVNCNMADRTLLCVCW
jgi:hypothetical protein